MKGIKKSFAGAALTAFCLCLALPMLAEESGECLRGKVYFLDKEGVSLSKKMESALEEFKKTGEGDYYFTGYAFPSRHQIRIGKKWDLTEPYNIKVSNGKIKLSNWNCTSTDEGRGYSGIVFLHRITKGTAEIADIHLIGIEQPVEFPDTSMYWLGDAESEESLKFCEGLFESGSDSLRKEMLFVIGSHDDPGACDFLYDAALGDYSRKIKESAVFWLGNYKTEKSIKYLKDIYNKAKDSSLRKQVVFAFYLNQEDEAVSELIKIAKADESRKVRKNAIFWLGQIASQECVKALKDVVEKDEDVELKKSAVFAISQFSEETAVPMLIEIAKTNKSPSVRKNAIFWLGQKDSKEALKFFEDILLKK